MNRIVVSVAVLYQNDKVLLCQRKANARYGLKWEFPGGKIEPNETPFQGLERELFEELSIKAKVDRVIWGTQSDFSDGGKFEVYFFIVEEWTNELQNNVFEKYEWVEPDRLLEYDILEGNKLFVAMLPKLLKTLINEN